jgi:hypothetical protein
LADCAVDLDGLAGVGNREPRAMRRVVPAVCSQVMGATMLQTLSWRGARIAPPKLAPGGWWQRRSALSLPRLGVLVGMLALAWVGLWAVREYADHRAELRLAETNRLLDQSRAGPVAEAWARLRTAWRAEQKRQDVLLARMPSLAGRELARTLSDHQMFVLETIEEYRLQDDIEVVRQYLARLAMCVRMESCDADLAAAQLGPALWTFRDQHRYYFEFEYSGVDLDDDLETIAPRAPGSRRAPRW